MRLDLLCPVGCLQLEGPSNQLPGKIQKLQPTRFQEKSFVKPIWPHGVSCPSFWKGSTWVGKLWKFCQRRLEKEIWNCHLKRLIDYWFLPLPSSPSCQLSAFGSPLSSLLLFLFSTLRIIFLQGPWPPSWFWPPSGSSSWYFPSYSFWDFFGFIAIPIDIIVPSCIRSIDSLNN